MQFIICKYEIIKTRKNNLDINKDSRQYFKDTFPVGKIAEKTV